MKPFHYRHFIALFAMMLLLACNNSQRQAASITPVAVPEQTEQQRQLEGYRIAIDTLLRQDEKKRNAAFNNYTMVAVGMRRLDLSRCPREFAVAYVDHIHAWDDAAQVQEALNQLRSDDNTKNALATTIIQKLLGSDDNAIVDGIKQEQQLKEAAKKADDEVTKTYHEVERITTSYGAKLP